MDQKARPFVAALLFLAAAMLFWTFMAFAYVSSIGWGLVAFTVAWDVLLIAVIALRCFLQRRER